MEPAIQTKKGPLSMATNLHPSAYVGEPVDPGKLVIPVFPVDPSLNPDNPVIERVYDSTGQELAYGASTDDPRVVVTGHGGGEPGNTIYLMSADGSHELGEGVVQADGSWRITAFADLLQGEQSGFFAISDGGFKADLISDVFVLDERGHTPSALAIASITDNAGTPTLHGTANGGQVIYIYDNGKYVAQVFPDANGHWQFDKWSVYGIDISHGEHVFTLSQGAYASTPVEFNVSPHDAVAQSAGVAPQVDAAPVDPVQAVDPTPTLHVYAQNGDAYEEVSNGGASAGTVFRAEGEAAPGSTFTVVEHIGFLGGLFTAETHVITADSNGHWSLDLENDLSGIPTQSAPVDRDVVIVDPNGDIISKIAFQLDAHSAQPQDSVAPVPPNDPVQPVDLAPSLHVYAVDNGVAHQLHEGESVVGTVFRAEGTAEPGSVLYVRESISYDENRGPYQPSGEIAAYRDIAVDANGHWSVDLSDTSVAGSRHVDFYLGDQLVSQFDFHAAPSAGSDLPSSSTLESATGHQDILDDGSQAGHSTSTLSLNDVLSTSDAHLFAASAQPQQEKAVLSAADVESQWAEAPQHAPHASVEVSSANVTALHNHLLPQEHAHHA
jgi:hypothetical protein